MTVGPPGIAVGGADAGVAFGVSCGADAGSSMPVPLPPAEPGIPPQIPATVTQAATPVPPLSGGTLLALADGVTAVAADPERDQVYFVDLTTNALRATVKLNPGDEPGRAIADDAGRVHVALRGGGAVVSIDSATATITARRDVCSAPRGIAFEKVTGLLHVACAGGELVSLPSAGGAATRTLTLQRDLRDVVVGAGGSLLVSTFRDASVLTIGSDGKVGQTMQPPTGIMGFIGPPRTVSPAVAWRMVPLGDSAGSVVMLHQMDVDDAINPVAGAYGGIKGCGAIASPAISVMAPGGTAGAPPAGLEMASLAIDVAVAPGGLGVAVAVPGNAYTPGMPTIIQTDTTTLTTNMGGGGPSCIDGTTGLSTAPPPGQVVAVSYASSGILLAQTREPATLWRGDSGVVIPLATDSREDTGHLIFHVNAGGGLACASCHPEGGEDGRVWNFTCLGLRRTQSIRGGISATAPFHWDGAEKDFSHLMDDVFSGRMSGPPLGADQKQSLESWVDTIKLLPPTQGLDSAAVTRGQGLFNDPKVACASCHAGSLLTNNATVDVGTGEPLQVPSLRGVSWRAPFMHNGCAATLADRFDPSCGGGDKHGATSQLTSAQVGDLVTYLQSL